MTFFIIGCVVFVVGALIQIFFWYIGEDELSLFFMWSFALMTFYFYSYGKLIFSDEAYKWILFSVASLILVSYVIYTIHYCIDLFFEVWILGFVPPATLEIIFIINTFHKMNLSWLSFLQTVVNWILIVGVCSVLVAAILFFTYYLGSSNQEKKLKGYYNNVLKESLLFNRDVAKIRLIGTTQRELDPVLEEIYVFLNGNEEKVNGRHLPYFFIESEISQRITVLPENTKNLIKDRLQYMDFYKKALQLGLSEFKSLLFPEYYENSSNETQSVQQRILEELPSKIIKIVNQNMVINGDANINQARDLFQSQMRQLFHSLMTPIIAIENSIKLVNISHGDKDYLEIIANELASIENSFKLVKSLLYAYRRVAMVDFSDGNTFICVSAQAQMTVESLNRQYSKKCLLEIKGKFEKMSGFASELIIALLVPLLQNAVEASPNEGKIILSEYISFNNIVIEVVNNSIDDVDNQILQSDGKSSKVAHEGLGLSSVRSIASQMQVEFFISSTGHQVTAQLIFPIRKEGVI